MNVESKTYKKQFVVKIRLDDGNDGSERQYMSGLLCRINRYRYKMNS